jgi:prepilin signal peptidase PulO-like enzyme (type II secretory pathway)
MILQSVFIFVLGLVFGSFITALTWRFPKRISIIRGRSICPNCKKQIAWYDNIPVLSYIILRGKCRNCARKISWRYPVIELITAIGFVLIGFQIFHLILFCILEIIFVIDLEHQIIPDFFVFLGILVSFFVVQNSPFTVLLSGFICATSLLLIHLFTKGRGMGLGDVKLAVLGGILVGLSLSPVWLLVAFLTGGITGIILILGKKAHFKSKIAFGPFLVISIPITLLWGQKIIDIIFLR